MPNLLEIYDVEFFREWGLHNDKYISSAQKIVSILHEQLKPSTLVDVGCGCGVYSHEFIKRGVPVLSIDGVRPPPEECFPVKIEIQDLSIPFEHAGSPFDYALCLEVAEHIPEMYVGIFLENLIKLSDKIILSAAPPHQGGHHHVNEQPKRYWVQKMSEKGFTYNRKQTGVLQEIFKKNKPDFMWMAEHISIYKKNQPGEKPPAEMAFGIKAARF